VTRLRAGQSRIFSPGTRQYSLLHNVQTGSGARQDGSVDIVTRLRAGQSRIFLPGTREYSLLHNVQTGSGARQDGSVDIVTGLRAGQSRIFSLPQCANWLRGPPSLGKYSSQRVNNSPASRDKDGHVLSWGSAPPYVLMAWFLIKHRDNLT
jgi:hypothetical protein